jgi:hypothetical protein
MTTKSALSLIAHPVAGLHAFIELWGVSVCMTNKCPDRSEERLMQL